jgi:hypothetical protein
MLDDGRGARHADGLTGIRLENHEDDPAGLWGAAVAVAERHATPHGGYRRLDFAR